MTTRYERSKQIQDELVTWIAMYRPEVYDVLALTPFSSIKQARTGLVVFMDRVNKLIYGRHYEKSADYQFFYFALPEGFPDFIHWNILLKAPRKQKNKSKRFLMNDSFFETYHSASFFVANKMQHVLSNKPITLHGRTPEETWTHVKESSSYAGKSLWYEKAYEHFEVFGRP